MSGGHWEELRELLDAALDLPAEERTRFLDQACAGRPGLRAELADLGAAHERASLLDTPAIVLPDIPRRPIRASIGDSVLHYRILQPLGYGGMGVVYQAHDTRLARTVALKFLPSHLRAEPLARERLRIEAQAAAALDHPNICTIHEIGETPGGQAFITMPYYAGETLRDRLERGPLPLDDALSLALQAARGLAAAHQRGVIHRDIKPANLMLTGEGVLKILDFGIAKLPDMSLTAPGELPGTTAYMSPEQINTETIDGRADVWSLGVVLHEMLTGSRPFTGVNQFALMHAILSLPPAVVPESVAPAPVRCLLEQMLARVPAERCTAAVLVRQLELLTAAPAAEVPGARDRAAAPELLPGGEQRHVTVLAVRGLGAGHDGAREIIRRHGGVVNEVERDTLVALFGVPVTHEDDGARAVRAALELHRTMPPSTATASGPRVAVHAGSAAVRVSEEPRRAYRLSGAVATDTVKLAELAPPGHTWVSHDLHRLLGGVFDTRPAAPVSLSDDGTVVAPFLVTGSSDARGKLDGIARERLTAFAGRAREMNLLAQAVDSVMAGEGRLIVVAGEAGMGKSRLLFELRDALRQRHMVILQGRCDSTESGAAYVPFVGALKDWLDQDPLGQTALTAEGIVSRIRSLGGELEEFLPLYLHLFGLPDSAHPVPRHLLGENFRLAMQEAVTVLVSLIARQRPTALLLEDWHWADEASDGVLQQVAEIVGGTPLLVVATSRPGTRARGAAMRHWADPAEQVTIGLRPIDAAASVAMLQSILGAERVAPQVAALVHERAGGNPFFLEEIAQTLLEDGALTVRDDEVTLSGARDQLKLPDTVQGVLRARLDRLDRAAREVLCLAAIVGREFTRGVLERASDPGRLPHALQALKAAGVIQQIRVVPEPAYRFKHVLIQEAAAGSLLEQQRKELHGIVGEAIEALYPESLEDHALRLADHFSRAEQWLKAVRYAVRAAERSNALSQFAESLELLERAQNWLLQVPDGAERRALLLDILFRQERDSETLGLRSRQQRIIDELVALLEGSGQRIGLAEAYQRQGDLYTLLRRFDEAETALDRALELRQELGDAAGDALGERNLLRSLGLLRWHQGRSNEALAYIEQALLIDRQEGDREAEAGELSNLGTVLNGMGQSERARATLEEALALSMQLERGRADKVAYTLHNLATSHRAMGNDARALEYLEQARALTAEKRLPIQLSFHTTSTAHIYLTQGRVEESLALYREAVDLTRKAKFAPGLAQALRILGEVLLGLGRDAEALDVLLEATTLFAQLRDPATEAQLWASMAGLRERRGELREAFSGWGKARTLHGQAENHTGELDALEGLARVGRRYLPDASLALGHYREALELADRLEEPLRAAHLRNAMGIVEWTQGRYDEAREHYGAALRIFRVLGNRAGVAHSLASLGVTLDAMGRRVEARRSLEEALLLQRDLGDGEGEARTLGALTDVLRRLGEVERAISCGEASLRLREARGDRTAVGWMLQRLALAHLANGARERARERIDEATRIAEELGDHELAGACRDMADARDMGR